MTPCLERWARGVRTGEGPCRTLDLTPALVQLLPSLLSVAASSEPRKLWKGNLCVTGPGGKGWLSQEPLHPPCT